MSESLCGCHVMCFTALIYDHANQEKHYPSMLNPSNYILLDVDLIFSSYHVLQIWPYFDVSITFIQRI